MYGGQAMAAVGVWITLRRCLIFRRRLFGVVALETARRIPGYVCRYFAIGILGRTPSAKPRRREIDPAGDFVVTQ
jgi:hypothetical protein